MAAKAFISGCAGQKLTPEEVSFFKASEPWGLILFKRNCAKPQQIRDLTDSFREVVGRADAPVLIDEEGGRVQRLQPPLWPAFPPARVIGLLAEAEPEAGRRTAWLQGRLLAAELAELGITVDCVPVLDVIAPGATEAIGNRSFGGDPDRVATLGRAVAEGILDGGLLPVMKHIPGHGRAVVDSHHALPVVHADLEALFQSDFKPFAALSDLPMAMTSHIVFPSIDPANPATTSAAVIRDIIRDRIGFSGLLMSDDVSMNALSGDYATRAARIYAAGCDLVLHCNGRIEEMRAIADVAPPLAGKAGERAFNALRVRREAGAFDREAGRAELLALVARAGWAAAA